MKYTYIKTITMKIHCSVLLKYMKKIIKKCKIS